MSLRPRRYRLTANLFAIPFGVGGLAQCWTIAAQRTSVPSWPGDVLWLAATALWLSVLIGYSLQLGNGRTLTGELADPTFGPFVALAAIIPMLLSGALARHARDAGHVVFVAALIATLLAGGWLSGQWILSDTTLARWHPGYFIPTVAGGLIAAATSANLDHRALAQFMFGYGAICWQVLGSIMLARLFTQPALPIALTSTIAIEVAPPALAGLAWFNINGGRADQVAFGIAGYGLLMILVQLRLIPLFRTVPFGPGWWAFTFSYAAAAAYLIRWLAVERVTGRDEVTWLLLVVVTLGYSIVVLRTVRAIAAGRFFPLMSAPARDPRASTDDAAPRDRPRSASFDR